MQLALPDEGPEEEARRRLDERLKLFCLVERKVKGVRHWCDAQPLLGMFSGSRRLGFSYLNVPRGSRGNITNGNMHHTL